MSALIAPFGIADAANPGFNLYGTPAAERMAHLFAKGVPDAFVKRFAHLGDEEAPVASYLSDVAAANILWPFGERGLAKRLHRITAPRLTLWGDLDEINPVSNAAAWGAPRSSPVPVTSSNGMRPIRSLLLCSTSSTRLAR